VAPGDVAFVTTFNAKTGSASFDNAARTCANVSCHGGKVAPSWQTGTITVNTQCSSCHAYGTTQYNGPTTSNHNRSEHSSQACTVCHNTTTLAVNHFTKLNTTAMEGPASATVGGGTTRVTYTPSSKSCSPSGSGCHGSKTW
jgi:predicted CxxxxCH...CXXCH cytochrome family protein